MSTQNNLSGRPVWTDVQGVASCTTGATRWSEAGTIVHPGEKTDFFFFFRNVEFSHLYSWPKWICKVAARNKILIITICAKGYSSKCQPGTSINIAIKSRIDLGSFLCERYDSCRKSDETFKGATESTLYNNEGEQPCLHTDNATINRILHPKSK